MVLEGYASVTTRRVAGIVGQTAALVHYYYPTTEDLLVATYRRAVKRHDERVRQALGSDRPLHGLWNFYSDHKRMALGVEFMAMANHRKVIRAEIRKHDERDRRLQAKALSKILADSRMDLKMCTPLCAAMLLNGISRSLVMDAMLGISCAHADTRAFVERLLSQVERTRNSPSRLRRTGRYPKSVDAHRPPNRSQSRPSLRSR
jgi:AcrR family transcriptional regulator